MPARRAGYDLRTPRLLLHAEVDEDGYERLRTSGILRCEPTRSHLDDDRPNAWMPAQHRLRVTASTGAPLLRACHTAGTHVPADR